MAKPTNHTEDILAARNAGEIDALYAWDARVDNGMAQRGSVAIVDFALGEAVRSVRSHRFKASVRDYYLAGFVSTITQLQIKGSC